MTEGSARRGLGDEPGSFTRACGPVSLRQGSSRRPLGLDAREESIPPREPPGVSPENAGRTIDAPPPPRSIEPASKIARLGGRVDGTRTLPGNRKQAEIEFDSSQVFDILDMRQHNKFSGFSSPRNGPSLIYRLKYQRINNSQQGV